jgi:hypothetical protein
MFADAAGSGSVGRAISSLLTGVSQLRTWIMQMSADAAVLGKLAEGLAIKQNAASFELSLINVKDVIEASKNSRD